MEPPDLPLTDGDAPPAPVARATAPEAPARRIAPALYAAMIFVASVIACLLAYAAVTVPGSWFPRALPKAWGASDLTLVRGKGQIVGDELRVSMSDAEGVALVTVAADLRSSDYAAISWIGIDFPDGTAVSLLWRTDYAPERLNLAHVRVESGHLLPTVVKDDPAWIGRITGVALAIRGALPQPIRIRGVVAKPMGLAETLGDRAREWLAFEGWTGTSINTIAGGADIQDLPLPLLLVFIVVIAGAGVAGIRHWRPGAFNTATSTVVVAFFLTSWLLLDVRWTWNLMRQAKETATQFAGKTSAQRRETEADSALYEFVEKALAVLPRTPARVFVVSDAHYFRSRAAYHLLPHRVYAEPRSFATPPSSIFRPGDWLLVYQRRGIQYNAAQRKLRWDDGQTISAEAKLVEPGGALFLIE